MIEIIPNWHPILVHFTVGLLAASVVFYSVSILLPVSEGLRTNWMTVARWCLWTGASVTLLTLAAGFYAYNTVNHDTPSHAAMTDHRNWALATAGAFFLLTLWSVWLRFRNNSPGIAFLVVALLGGVLLASTGWRGGEVVYRYGLGVMSLPNVGGEGHDHAHEDDTAHQQDAPSVDVKPGMQTLEHKDDGHKPMETSGSQDSETAHTSKAATETVAPQEPNKEVHEHKDGNSHVH